MAIGDDAVAAGYIPAPGTIDANTIDTEIARLADWVANRTNDVAPVDMGGTGSTNPTGARTNLGIPAWDIYATPGTLIIRAADGLFAVATALYASNPVPLQQLVDLLAAKADASALAGKADTSAVDAKVSKGGDTMSGNLFLPNASSANSGFTVCYINGDGRVSRGSSSIRYKNAFGEVDPLSLGDLFPPLDEYAMKDDLAQKHTLGHFAETLAAHPDQERFVVYQWETDDDGNSRPTDVPESIDFIQLLLAQTAQLHAALDLVTQRLENLENR